MHSDASDIHYLGLLDVNWRSVLSGYRSVVADKPTAQSVGRGHACR